jgi:hypothetical protein
VKQFLARIVESTHTLESHKQDTGRLLTVFQVKLESTKKIANADVVVGVEKGVGDKGPLVVTKTMDPNDTHPLRTSAVVEAVKTLHGMPFTSGTFQAIAWKHGMKSNRLFCWRSAEGQLVKYSHDAVTFIKRLTQGDVELAKKEYREQNRRKRASVPATAMLPLGSDQSSGAAS